MKWPVIETYVTAGRTPKKAIRAIGGFNVAWAGSVPLALLVTGPLIEYDAQLLFALAAAIHVTTLVLLWRLPARPAHLDLDHPDRPDPETLARYTQLQTSARWAMLGSYAMLFLLAPLLPEIFASLGHGVKTATGLSAGLDVARLLTFAALGVFTGWRGKRLPLTLAILGLPLGLFATLFAPTTAGVLLGEADLRGQQRRGVLRRPLPRHGASQRQHPSRQRPRVTHRIGLRARPRRRPRRRASGQRHRQYHPRPRTDRRPPRRGHQRARPAAALYACRLTVACSGPLACAVTARPDRRRAAWLLFAGLSAAAVGLAFAGFMPWETRLTGGVLVAALGTASVWTLGQRD